MSFFANTDSTDSTDTDMTDPQYINEIEEFAQEYEDGLENDRSPMIDDKSVSARFIEIENGINVQKNREAIALQYQSLVYKIAHSASTLRIPFDDKVQYGMVGLMLAIDKYNVHLGHAFSTYCTTTVRVHIYRYGGAGLNLVQIPTHKQMLLTKFNRLVQRARTDAMNAGTRFSLDAQSTRDLIMSELEISADTYEDLIYHSSVGGNLGYDMMDSLDYVSDDGVSSQDKLQCEVQEVQKYQGDMIESDMKNLDRSMECLGELDRELVQRFYGTGSYDKHTLDEILSVLVQSGCDEFNSTASLYRRIRNSLDTIKQYIQNTGIEFVKLKD